MSLPQPLRQSARKLWLAVFALGLLLTHGARVAHMLLVEHVVCEHGDLVDDAKHRSSRAAVSAQTSHEASEAIEPGDPGSSFEHDHCDVASILHRADLDVSVRVGSALLSHFQPVMLSQGVETRFASPLDVAPKGSPPRA